jgi:hypothetical protein
MPDLGPILGHIILKMNIGRSWGIRVKDINGEVVLNRGWVAFSIARNL